MGGFGKGIGKGLGLGMITVSEKIDCLRWTLISFTVLSWILGVVVFALCIWLKADPSYGEWVDELKLDEFYIGVYVMLFGACVIVLTSCLGCVFIVSENVTGMKIMIGFYVLKFICGLIGAAVLLNYSTQNSDIQPMIRESMQILIADSHYEKNANMLRLIQENIGCCGADGPRDYIQWRKPLPAECRDTVTGNAFFHGCVDELTWYLGERSAWLAGAVMVLCFFNILKLVFTLNLIKAVNASGY